MRKELLAGALLALASTAAMAQDVYHWPAPAAYTGHEQKWFFPMGTPLTLATRTQISTKDARPGDRIYLRVAESLTFDGQVVVPVGAPAVGEVVRSDRNGHFGKKGKLDINLLYVQTPSGPVQIEGVTNKEGSSGTVASFATIAIVSPLGFLIHGTSATIPFGSTIHAYLAEPLRFTEQAAQPELGQSVQVENAQGLAAVASAKSLR